MKKDRFLIGILVFIGLLVIAAILLFIVRGRTPAYVTEDTPQGVVHNYALALQQGNYERAFSYLSDNKGKPILYTFRQQFQGNYESIQGVALQVGETQMTDSDTAQVSVTVIYGGDNPFSQTWNHTDSATLIREGGEWKLISMPYPYWYWGWYLP